jgi:hypothetical protein
MVKFLEDELEFLEPFTDAGSAMDRISKCYLKSSSVPTYDKYVAGVRYVLGPNRVYKDVLIQRRGQGMCQDNTILAADNFRIYHSNTYYFCFHAFKTPTLLEQMVNSQECLDDVFACRSDLTECGDRLKRYDVHKVINQFQPMRDPLGGINDVKGCWPNCPTNIPRDEWQAIAKGLRMKQMCY